MHRFALLLTAVSALTITAWSAAIHTRNLPYPIRTIYQYHTNDTWLENLAIRRNGNILLTSIGKPGGLHCLDPSAKEPTPSLLDSFPTLNSTSGIVETTPDTFYVAVSNASIESLIAQPGSNYIYRIDFIPYWSIPPTVTHLSHIPEAGLLNGLTALSDTLLLAADSTPGDVYSIDTITGCHRKVMTGNPSPLLSLTAAR